ncbi:type VI secretion system ImpA family N-terminal domain-containing protein [Mesorhizobium sp. LHD-90]|uniref:type VI secretion system protein TssA n=1 Tax=Mesorhizobium sp. LHD-90 TaxID=3071414 RepID=UPI0027E19926|nr:type VI secretion system ImpA family N-terminal domain-containing protein [Mesorhizobium sp. LHD-90]MDQ6434717.1 type VI secretion system ImpA family N-terminal domain-containing protein [Mesorhizobium sp. LHD-90]
MRFESLLNPVSETEPCGPDLDEVGDDQYLNYMLGADNRMPTRYLDAETGAPVDCTGIDLKAESKSIGEFLRQSRDLRLLTLEARLQVLSGQLIGFSECLQAIAVLLEKYWEDVHPRGYEGDFTLRQNTIGVLEDRTTVILPLQYAPIVRDQRAGPISLRNQAVALGSAAAREDERSLDINQIIETLRSEGHRAEIDSAHAAATAAKAALASIQSSFDQATNYEYSPNFELLSGVLDQLLKFIYSARPDLAGAEPEAVEDEQPADAGEESSPLNGAASLASKAAGRAEAVAVADHASAAAALLAAEQYFGRSEPSSPALILVHQARLLVGKPLVAALEALLPDHAEYASIVVDSSVGFEFNMTKMRAITEDYASMAEETPAETDAMPEFKAENRQQAVALLTGVAAFFRSVEPSSPIPMVLGRAERFTSQSFQSIIADLMPRKASE